jgi:YihY family inner membrane protein
MSSTNRVPETRDMHGDELSADEAWETLREYGRLPLLRDAFVRFRYGDGFSHARAFALQLCLAAVPFLIALTGLAADLGQEKGGQVVADTVLALTPGDSEVLVRDVLVGDERAEEAGEVALALGLLTGIAALTTAMAQVERGANRMYGDERDRPALRKYIRAFVLSLVAGIPMLLGFLVLVGGESLGEAVQREYRWGGWVETTFDVARWPLGLALTVLSVAVLFERSPRRRQPQLSWLAFGAGLSTVLWVLASVLLAVYVQASGAFGETYGPLAGIVALLLWANLTGIALFLGIAFAAQMEALRAGVPDPSEEDVWGPDDDRANRWSRRRAAWLARRRPNVEESESESAESAASTT